MDTKGVSLDDSNFQSFSVLMVPFRDLMMHSLENLTRNLRASWGLKGAKALNALPLAGQCTVSIFLEIVWEQGTLSKGEFQLQ